MKKQDQVGFRLPDVKVKIKPIIKPTPFIPNTNHVAAFLAPNAKNRFSVPINQTGYYVDILDEREKDYFESQESGLSLEKGDLSVYKKENNFWEKFELILGKEEVILDLSNPIDYMKYKLILFLKNYFCFSSDKINTRASYKYLVIDLNQEIEKQSNDFDLKTEAYIRFAELKTSRKKMLDFLKLIGKSFTSNVSDDVMKSEIAKFIESKNGAKQFIEILSDPNYEYKVLFRDALRIAEIVRKDKIYYTKDLRELGRNEEEVIEFLSNPINQEIFIELQHKVKKNDGSRV